MNYIVFDLEWNQSPGGKKYSNSRLPFEIIEIGAVKMNEKREPVDVFQRLIKPQSILCPRIRSIRFGAGCSSLLVRIALIPFSLRTLAVPLVA